MRRFAKCYPVKLGEALPWCCVPLLRRTSVRVGPLEELRSNGRRFNRVAASPRQFAHPAAYACRASGSSGTSRTSVSTTSVTATGRSITSTATGSTTGATGCLIRRAAFFTGARLGLALATVRLVAFAAFALRALLRIAVFALRSFPPFCTFDFFLRLAMIAPFWLLPPATALTQHGQVPATNHSSYQQIVL
jgi:hypothetical protein